MHRRARYLQARPADLGWLVRQSSWFQWPQRMTDQTTLPVGVWSQPQLSLS
jgi:hypothetical protein